MTDAEFAAEAERCRPQLVRCVALLTGDADEAESLAQEALARALANPAAFDPSAGTPLGAWLRGVAVNLSRNYLRTRARRAKPAAPEALAGAAAGGPGVLSGIVREEAADRLWRAVADLPQAYREVVVLHEVEGMGYAEIAAVTGDTVGALRARALRARALLRDSLGSVVDTWLRGE